MKKEKYVPVEAYAVLPIDTERMKQIEEKPELLNRWTENMINKNKFGDKR